MKKAYIESKGGIQMHYRTAGAGKPIVLLHPSPRSSAMLEPFGTMLSAHFQVFAIDLFGYGRSDVLPFNPQSLADYLPYLKTAFDNLGLSQLAIYGSATGAQLAAAYALKYANSVQYVFLDNAAHFTDAQRADILKQYFPDFTPRTDGAHVQSLWQHVVDSTKYFPWYDSSKPLNTPSPPPSVIQDIFTDYCIAGSGYADAYRAAFAHEKAEHIQALLVPTILFKWLQSPILPFMEQLHAFDLPANVQIVETVTATRLVTMKEVIRTCYADFL